MGEHLQKKKKKCGRNFNLELETVENVVGKGEISPFSTMFSNVNLKLLGLFGKELK